MSKMPALQFNNKRINILVIFIGFVNPFYFIQGYVIGKIDNQMVQRNYNQIREEVQEIVNAEIQRMMNDPELERLVVRK
ncbi:hypothetical protein OKW96_15920 [Sphingobacterium sp. KU25419]|nr:hypothetical protein OKW96_15920 [Sphingobacterium sp. KU25419]